MTGEPTIRLTHPGLPGEEFQMATQAAFDAVWSALGWVLADPEDQPDVVYSIPSTEKGAPFGVATLNAAGLVEQAYEGGSGGLNESAVNDLIDAKVELITHTTHGWIPDTTPVVLFVDNTLQMTKRTTHPSTNPFVSQYYTLTDNSVWVMAPTGVKTQVAPGFVNPTTVLALEKTVDSITLSTALSTTLEPEGVYAFEIIGTYESTVAASGERLRFFLEVPPGATGIWGVQGLAVTQAAANGSASYAAKLFSETFDIGGSGATVPRYFKIQGTIYCDTHEPAPDAEANFDFRVRLSTIDGAGVPLVPAKIYGGNTANHDACRMTFTRLA